MVETQSNDGDGWQAFQRELTSRSSAEGIGHLRQAEAPPLVVSAVDDVVGQVRRGRSR